MQDTLRTRSFWSMDALSSEDWQRIHDTAAMLRQATGAGQAQRPLRGKNVAVLCETADHPRLLAFRQAAAALGAHVTQVRPSDARLTEAGSIDAMGHLLGRLYDAIDCHDLPLPLVERLAQVAGKPVIDNLACRESLPVRASEGGRGTGPEAAHFLLQALLLAALA